MPAWGAVRLALALLLGLALATALVVPPAEAHQVVCRVSQLPGSVTCVVACLQHSQSGAGHTCELFL